MAEPAACHSCGYPLPSPSQEASEAQARITDLETQVRLLNSKASATADKLADYEDEIRNLRAQCTKLQKERQSSMSVAPLNSSSPKEASLSPPPPEKDSLSSRNLVNRQSMSRLSSLGSLLTGRKHGSLPDNTIPAVPPLSVGMSHMSANQSTPNLTTPAQEYMEAPSPPPFATDPGPKAQSLTLIGLQTTLETEREMRRKAENNLQNAQSELEELTAQLFGQANEMVATERKARAKLEERVQLLETRDGDKRHRLERLEKAVERIERVRRLVVEHEQGLEKEKENLGRPFGALQRSQTEKVITPLRARQTARSRRRHGLGITSSYGSGNRRPEVVSEDEEETEEGGSLTHDEFKGRWSYEFDVHLKVWRRSRANIWESPSLD